MNAEEAEILVASQQSYLESKSWGFQEGHTSVPITDGKSNSNQVDALTSKEPRWVDKRSLP